jgi:hypothetical protein
MLRSVILFNSDSAGDVFYVSSVSRYFRNHDNGNVECMCRLARICIWELYCSVHAPSSAVVSTCLKFQFNFLDFATKAGEFLHFTWTSKANLLSGHSTIETVTLNFLE